MRDSWGGKIEQGNGAVNMIKVIYIHVHKIHHEPDRMARICNFRTCEIKVEENGSSKPAWIE